MSNIEPVLANPTDTDTDLAQLPFSDLYLEPDGQAWYKTYRDDPVRHALPAHTRPAIVALRESVLQQPKSEFRLVRDGVGMRGARFEIDGGTLFVLRRTLEAPLDFLELGYGSRVEAAMLSPASDGGRVYLFSGETGSGKTVGLSAWTVERMRRFGGAAFTLENPIEIPMNGVYLGPTAEGTVYQQEIDDDAQFGLEVRRRQRAAPNLIMLGELRTAEAVVQALLAAASGIVIGATFHAADQISGLQRLASMVRDAGYDPGLFANSLAAVLHQKLTRVVRDGQPSWRLTVSPLIVNGSKEETSIRSQLHGADFRQLKPIIDRHRSVMSSSDPGMRF
ncbi:ATPase, T2SS/T4P/T4SS family [Burkholderia gladioli]|uniref:ATPase, T2SS/T4P/T4SS family n=1 Tax=Burkholderia gladioli TaxID=28095 RepID=UPI0034DB670B